MFEFLGLQQLSQVSRHASSLVETFFRWEGKARRRKAEGRRRKEKEKWEVRIKKYKNVSIMNPRHDDIASALPANLDALPRLHEFRLRGM